MGPKLFLSLLAWSLVVYEVLPHRTSPHLPSFLLSLLTFVFLSYHQLSRLLEEHLAGEIAHWGYFTLFFGSYLYLLTIISGKLCLSHHHLFYSTIESDAKHSKSSIILTALKSSFALPFWVRGVVFPTYVFFTFTF